VNMKQFTIIKVGYSHGYYGCSGEYFIAIIINGSKNESIRFNGLYGAEERVAGSLKKKGYREFYTPSQYGQLKGEERKYSMGEHSAIEYIKNKLKL